MRVRSLIQVMGSLMLLMIAVVPAFAQVDHFEVIAAGGGAIGTQSAGVPFAVRITAQKSDNSTDAAFTGKAFVSSTGTLTAGGDSTAAFVDGVLTSHSVTIGNTGNFTITAAHDAATAGRAAAFR